MPITDRLILPSDVLLLPVRDLKPSMRAGIDCDDGDFALTRPAGRARSMVIDPDFAALLGFFRTPRTMVEAVVLYCARHGGDPREVLDAAYPLIERIYQRKLLTDEGAGEGDGLDPKYAAGTEVGEWRLVRSVQTLEDTEVHEVTGPRAARAAMKIVREPNRSWLVSMFARERQILDALGGAPGPRLLDSGSVEGCDYLVVEWIDGEDVLASSHEIRRAGGVQARTKLAALCLAILEAYAALHADGILHSDIHPRNALVDAAGTVTLIDFGISRLIDPPIDFVEPPREGVGYFFEPEYAHAALGGVRPSHPHASVAGEIYGLAGMLTLLITGHHYLDFPLERISFFKAIVNDTRVTFESRGLSPWPSVEAVLGRALQKESSARYETVADFAAAFRAVTDLAAGVSKSQASPTFQPSDSSDTSDLSDGADASDSVQAAEEPLDTSGVHAVAARRVGRAVVSVHAASPFRDLLPLDRLASHKPLPAPSCSINYGAAGVAYALLRVAELTGDASLLSAADLWSTKAVNECRTTSAAYSAKFKITAENVGDNAFYHTTAGVHCVAALVAHARWDVNAMRRALAAFVDAAGGGATGWDLTLGRSGLLLGCTLLTETIQNDPLVDRGALLTLGSRLSNEIWSHFQALPTIADGAEFPLLAIAHGWAGVLFAQLRWCQARGTLPPLGLEGRLDELAALAITDAGGLKWPRQNRTRPWATGVPGWCNGPAGFISLWTLAHGIFHDPRYLTLATGAATAVIRADTGNGSLCCGYAGMAYGLLSLYRATGHDQWLVHARTLAGRAKDSHFPESHPHSLYKGPVAARLLDIELQHPKESCLPLFESEGWPSG